MDGSTARTALPLCPACRARGLDQPLRWAPDSPDGRDGILHCDVGSGCGTKFPVIDSLPVLLPDLTSFAAEQFTWLIARADMSDAVADTLSAAVGPGSWYDVARQHVSIYAWDHWADLDPGEPAGLSRPGSALSCLDAVLSRLDRPPPTGAAIDLGCAAGRIAFELARRGYGPVVGLDLNIPMLRVAIGAARDGVARYPRRSIGAAYDARRITLPETLTAPGLAVPSFWVGDALQPPCAEGSFALAVALNVLDCVRDPQAFLMRTVQLLQPGGIAVIATPYDWSPGATAPSAWLDAEGRGRASPEALRTLAAALDECEIVVEIENLPWSVRLHDRSTMQYSTHALALRRRQ